MSRAGALARIHAAIPQAAAGPAGADRSLRDRLAALEAEVEWLRGELGLTVEQTEVAALRSRFGLTVMQANVLMVLYRAGGRFLSRAQIEARIERFNRLDEPSFRLVDNHIHHIRKRGGGELVESSTGLGWRCPPPALPRIAAALADVPRPCWSGRP